MALRSKVVDLVGLRVLDDSRQARGIRHIAVMQDEPATAHVRVLIEVVDTIRIEKRGPALYAVNDVALLEQKFGQIGAVLARDARYESDLWLGHCETAQCESCLLSDDLQCGGAKSKLIEDLRPVTEILHPSR